MITGPLLRARCTRDEVAPALVDPASPRYREAADALVEEAREAVAQRLTRGELEARIEERIVGNRVDHKLLRGLARVLTDPCEFDTRAPLPPAELRARLFAQGPVPRQPDLAGVRAAATAFAALARELGCEAEAVERGLFADLRENQVLLSCPVQSGEWLLHRYNAALVQGLLLHASELRIALPEPDPKRLRQLFRHVKFHQLMHAIRPEGAGYLLTLDGPASLFSLSTRYGMALARFFPALLLQPGPWRMEAELRYRRLHRPMRLTHEAGLVSHLPDHGTWVSREEEWFEERFRALDSGWELERGGDLLPLGGEAVLVPDFRLRRDGRVAYVEIVGVWRRGYLERRQELLRRHRHPELILCVSRALLGERGAAPEDLGAQVVAYARSIPVKAVLEMAERVAVPDPRVPR